VRLRFRESDRFQHPARQGLVLAGQPGSGNWRYSHNAVALFEAVALPVGETLLEFFADKIASAGDAELTWIAAMLAHTDNRFVFRHTDFVIGFLVACDRVGRTVRRRAAMSCSVPGYRGCAPASRANPRPMMFLPSSRPNRSWYD
jgi:hypothetical protein